jgi:hypothetical protein
VPERDRASERKREREQILDGLIDDVALFFFFLEVWNWPSRGGGGWWHTIKPTGSLAIGIFLY